MAYTYTEALAVIGGILQNQILSLTAGHIMFSNQKWTIPKDTGLYVALSYAGPSKVIGSVNEAVPNGGGMNEVQSVTMAYLVQIDVMSFDDSARQQKEFILMALNSIFSVQQQEANQMMIGRIPDGWVDASIWEAAKMLQRYIATVRVHQAIQQTKAIGSSDYYDDFSRAIPAAVAVN